MLAIVPPLMSSVGLTTELRGAARQLAAGMRSTRNLAISERVEAALQLDLDQRVFSVPGLGRTVQLPTDEDVRITLHTATAELVDETTGRIRFFPDGSSTGGYIALLDNRLELRVNVDWLTGRITIEERQVQ